MINNRFMSDGTDIIFLDDEDVDEEKAFCPTGQGGGIDPTCSPGASGGMTATKQGKDGKRTLANGNPLPEHIPKNIPPAWKDVSINLDPDADMVVKGTDSKGREIRMYSDNHKVQAAAKKFSRTSELLAKHEAIKKQIRGDLKSDDPNVREPASVMALIAETGIRPGSERDTGADKQAYGATTLQAKHVKVTGNKVRLDFVGKKGVDLKIKIDNPDVAEDLIDRKSIAEKPTSKLFNTNDHALRDYAKTLDGGKFKPKDFRTAVGTGTAASLVSKVKQPPTTMKEYKAAVRRVATEVSAKLGNTPTIALQSYINPSVFSAWRPK